MAFFSPCALRYLLRAPCAVSGTDASVWYCHQVNEVNSALILASTDYANVTVSGVPIGALLQSFCEVLNPVLSYALAMRCLVLTQATALRVSYVLPGLSPYGPATRYPVLREGIVLSAYALPMRCPVLRWGMVLPASKRGGGDRGGGAGQQRG
eukprot:2963434-Rhodomonas_salina.2